MKYNIIFVIDSSFPYYAGGIETWLYNVSMRLCDKHNVIIVSEQKSCYDTPFFCLDNRIEIVHYKTLNQIKLIRTFCRGPLQFIRRIGKINAIEEVLNKIIHRDNCYYYIAALTTLHAAEAVSHIREKQTNVRFICSARSLHAQIIAKKAPLLRKYYDNMERRNLHTADLALSNGYDTKKYFQDKGLFTSFMKNGVDCKRFILPRIRPVELPQKRFSIVSVATLLDIKGIKEMISAMAVLHNRGYKNIQLVLIGKGGQKKYGKQAFQQGVNENVSIIGHRSDVVPYLQYANVVCCLSGGAGLSMSALEAMASKKIIIAWDTPVYRQFNLQKKTMILVEEKNILKLADAIEQIYNVPWEYEELSRNAFEESKKYDWEIVMEDFVYYIKQIP